MTDPTPTSHPNDSTSVFVNRKVIHLIVEK